MKISFAAFCSQESQMLGTVSTVNMGGILRCKGQQWPGNPLEHNRFTLTLTVANEENISPFSQMRKPRLTSCNYVPKAAQFVHRLSSNPLPAGCSCQPLADSRQPILWLALLGNQGGKWGCRQERDIPCLWAGLLAKHDWNLGSELGSGTDDRLMEPQAVSDDLQWLERSGLMCLKTVFYCCLGTLEIQLSPCPRAFILLM